MFFYKGSLHLHCEDGEYLLNLPVNDIKFTMCGVPNKLLFFVKFRVIYSVNAFKVFKNLKKAERES